MRSLNGLAAAALLTMASGVHAQNLIADGGFESPVAPVGGTLTFSLEQSFSKWKVVGQNGNVQILNTQFTSGPYSFPAKSGQQSLDLTGNSNTATGVQQSVTTVIGQSYTLTFSVGNLWGIPDNSGTSSTVHVLLNGITAVTATNFNDGQDTVTWKTFSYTFTADSTSTSIAFVNGDPPSDGYCGLDAVSLVPTGAQIPAEP
jgi:hypothetical protein